MAKSISCRHCGNLLSKRDVVCESCGKPVKKERPKKQSSFEHNIIDENDALQRKKASRQQLTFGTITLQDDFNIAAFVLLLIFVWPFALLYAYSKIEK